MELGKPGRGKRGSENYLALGKETDLKKRGWYERWKTLLILGSNYQNLKNS